MKKICLLIITILFVSGCVNIKDIPINDLTKELVAINNFKQNIYRKGYKYYLPRGLKLVSRKDYNEIIEYNNHKMFMYVDIVSYHSHAENIYESNLDAYYSEKLSKNTKNGYIEINLVNSNKYLIEIMYNYAKIEVIVEKDEIKQTIAYVLNILNSIEYNDIVINNILEDDILNFTEEEYDIFSASGSESKYLNYVKEYDNYEDEDIQDNDLIN